MLFTWFYFEGQNFSVTFSGESTLPSGSNCGITKGEGRGYSLLLEWEFLLQTQPPRYLPDWEGPRGLIDMVLPHGLQWHYEGGLASLELDGHKNPDSPAGLFWNHPTREGRRTSLLLITPRSMWKSPWSLLILPGWDASPSTLLSFL